MGQLELAASADPSKPAKNQASALENHTPHYKAGFYPDTIVGGLCAASVGPFIIVLSEQV